MVCRSYTRSYKRYKLLYRDFSKTFFLVLKGIELVGVLVALPVAVVGLLDMNVFNMIQSRNLVAYMCKPGGMGLVRSGAHRGSHAGSGQGQGGSTCYKPRAERPKTLVRRL